MKKGLLLALAPIILLSLSSEGQLLQKIKNKIEKGLPGKEGSSDKPSSGKKFASGDFGHVKYKLRDGEKLLSGEECVEFVGYEKFMFITSMGGKFYFHNESRISGPFDKPPVDSLPCWKKEPEANTRTQKASSSSTSVQKYQTMDANSTVPFGLKIAGKSYGPFNMITALAVSPDESRFYAFVTMISKNDQMEYYLVSHRGKFKLPAMAVQWLISPDWEKCAVPMNDAQLKGNDEAAADGNAPMYLLFEDGHKTGPFANFYTSQQSIFTNSGKYIQLFADNRATLYVDGKPGLKFPKEIKSIDGVILNDGISAGAYFEYGNLYFTDGTVIEEEAIKPQIYRADGNVYARWMAIDGEGNIYDCSKKL